MRISRPIGAAVAAALLLSLSFSQARAQNGAENRPSLPDRVGGFRLQGQAKVTPASAVTVGQASSADYLVTGAEEGVYAAVDGVRFDVRVVRTGASGAAYSLLFGGAEGGASPDSFAFERGLGVLADSGPSSVRFVNGAALVQVGIVEGGTAGRDALVGFARLLSEQLGGEAGYVPPLILHLPEWEQKLGGGSGYAVTLPALQAAAGGRPVLDAVSFEGGAEAVTAAYGDARLVIVEFPTPQLSVENDERISERIAQLRAQGEPSPSFYRRVGNYSVFVFDAPGESVAEELASGVKYEKDVRWLGRNPREGELIERYYTQTMGSVIKTSLVTTGAALLLCLGVGGVVGGAVFFYRRARPESREAYSDAGGMMRLNLEDLDPARGANLLGPKRY